MTTTTIQSTRATTARWLVAGLALIAGLIFTAAALAGDIDPPAGPIQPTNRQTLHPTTTLPHTISAPGSYVLTGDLVGVPGDYGIVIDSDDVTIDLNGFSLIGVSGSISGVVAVGAYENITILDGLVRDWDGHGIDLNAVPGCRIVGVTCRDNDATGLLVGTGSHVEACILEGNGNQGLRAFRRTAVIDCTARENASHGFRLDEDVSIRGSSALRNGGNGIWAGPGCSVVLCHGAENGWRGIYSAGGGQVTASAAWNNTLEGIAVSGGGTVTDCASSQNSLSGFSIADGTLIRNCAAFENDLHGIAASTRCLLQGNVCDDNAQAGIHLLGATTRVQGNQVINNTTGIDVDSGGNIIVANVAADNGLDYSIVGGNDVGTIRTTPVGALAWDNMSY